MPPVARGLNLNLPVIPKTLFVGKYDYIHCSLAPGNLANSVTSELLENAFSQFGTVTQVKYMRTNHYAFITFASPKEATWAKANMNGITLEGRILRVSWGKAEGQTKYSLTHEFKLIVSGLMKKPMKTTSFVTRTLNLLRFLYLKDTSRLRTASRKDRTKKAIGLCSSATWLARRLHKYCKLSSNNLEELGYDLDHEPPNISYSLLD